MYFLPKQRTSLIEMLRLLKEALTLMDRNLRQNAADLDAVADVEGKINALTERLREKHLRDLDKGKYPASSGVFYNDLVNELEKCGDRVASVATHLASEGTPESGHGQPGGRRHVGRVQVPVPQCPQEPH